jgi:hypothetical protein
MTYRMEIVLELMPQTDEPLYLAKQKQRSNKLRAP